MIVKELLPRCNIPRAEVGITAPSTLWLDSQLVGDGPRLRLLSSRRERDYRCILAAHSVAGTRDANTRSPQDFPQAYRYQRGQQNHQPRSQTSEHKDVSIDPRAKCLVEELGVLGWRCKGLRRPHVPADILDQAGSLATALLLYVPDLPVADLAHCCWALAQLGRTGTRDPKVVNFVVAVQQELLVSRAAVAGANAHNPTWDSSPAAAPDEMNGDGRSGGPPLTHGTLSHDRATASAGQPSTSAPYNGKKRPVVRLWELEPKQLSKLAWAIAKLGIRPEAPVSDWEGSGPGGAVATPEAAASSASGPYINSSAASVAALAPRIAGFSGAEWRRLQLRWWRELGSAAAEAIRRVQMPPQALCNTLWSFATCDQQHPELLEAAAECIGRGRRTRYGPQGLASLFWAFSSLESSTNSSSSRSRTCATDAASAATASVSAGSCDVYDRMYGMLIQLAEPMIGDMMMRQLSNVAWGVVTKGLHRRHPAARRLLAAVCSRATEIVSAVAARAAVATAAFALPYEPALPPPAAVLGRMMGVMTADVEEEEEQDQCGRQLSVSQGARAHATAAQQLDSQSMTVLAWSLAQAVRPGHSQCVSYLEAVVSAAVAMQPGWAAFGDQDLAMLLMSHFHVRHYSAALVAGVRQEVLQRLQQRAMDPKALTNICYCLATSNYYNQELYEAVATAAANSLERYGPSLATRLVWSTARARHYSPQLLNAFSHYIRPQLAGCSAADMVAAASSLAQFHHYDPQLLRELSAEALTRTVVAPSEVTAVAADATARSQPAEATAEVLDAFIGGSSSGRSGGGGGGGRRRSAGSSGGAFASVPEGRLPARALVNLLWCFAVLSHVDETLLAALLARLRKLDIRRLTVQAIMQLCQAQVMLKDLYGDVIKAPEILTESQMEIALTTWQRVSAGATTVSRLQRDVVACLRRLGTHPRCERMTLDGLFSIDTSLEWGGRRVAVEVDGPSHFTCSRPFRPLGRTLAKRRCLEMRGWRVLSVPGHEWRALGGNPETENRYMRAALDGVLWRTHVLEGLSSSVP